MLRPPGTNIGRPAHDCARGCVQVLVSARSSLPGAPSRHVESYGRGPQPWPWPPTCTCTPPSQYSDDRLTLASRQLHRPRSHNPRLTRCYVGTLKYPASSGRPLEPSALRLNEWRKNAADCRSGTLTAASKHIGSSAARAAVQHMAAEHRCRHGCGKSRSNEGGQQERWKAWTVPMECWTACGRSPDRAPDAVNKSQSSLHTFM